jgi:hypothetical protein
VILEFSKFHRGFTNSNFSAIIFGKIKDHYREKLAGIVEKCILGFLNDPTLTIVLYKKS